MSTQGDKKPLISSGKPSNWPAADYPLFRVLTDEKLERIHQASLEILESTGVKMTVASARDMMAEAGCEIDGDIVRIPAKLVEDAIASAPKRFTVYDREGEEALHLGSGEVYTNTGYTSLEYFDIDTGERRDYTVDDFRLVSRVADALPNVDIIGQPGVVRPTPEDPLGVVNHLEFEAMLTNSSKPIYALVASGEILSDCYDMAEAVAVANGAESLSQKPFVLPMLNPISPLIYHDDTVDKLLITVDRGIPVICGPAPFAGATAPVSLAGTIALANAESLVGLVMSQVRKKGAPYVMITFSSAFDMKLGNPALGPDAELLIIGGLEMGHYYDIPISGGFLASGDKGVLDGQDGWDQVLRLLPNLLTRGNAGISVGPGPSLPACVMVDEAMSMLGAMAKGIPVDDESLAVDVIRDIGPGGGTYLGHPHTYKNFRELWEPNLMANITYEAWVAGGSMTLEDRSRERMREIIASHEPTPVPESARSTIKDIVAQAREKAPADVD